MWCRRSAITIAGRHTPDLSCEWGAWHPFRQSRMPPTSSNSGIVGSLNIQDPVGRLSCPFFFKKQDFAGLGRTRRSAYNVTVGIYRGLETILCVCFVGNAFSSCRDQRAVMCWSQASFRPDVKKVNTTTTTTNKNSN